MAFTPPSFKSMLSLPTSANNFMALQSAQLAVSNAGVSGSQSITFANFAAGGRITAKISNSGSKGCYLASGAGSATAVVSTGTPQPASGSVSNCDYISAGSIHSLDYPQGTDTFAAICAGADTTTLEISIGYGQ
ncbi:MAG: hypothetical protein KGJ90_06275 [Patescibacteria group bacterium]|nr:hypothetical protein [Patescibacteria group bacterium]